MPAVVIVSALSGARMMKKFGTIYYVDIKKIAVATQADGIYNHPRAYSNKLLPR
jgi:hypothetical protein